MRRLKKKLFLGSFGLILGTLTIVRACYPEVRGTRHMASAEENELLAGTPDTVETASADSSLTQIQSQKPISTPVQQRDATLATDSFKYHPIKSVRSYKDCFPDLQDVQIVAAKQWGVSPVRDREEAEKRRNELVYVGASPFFCIDNNMRYSIPYLVPRASHLLSTIGRNYLDSLYVKGIPLHRIIVSSVLRTEADVARLRRRNPNATEQSCHRFGTTFDICYNRFSTVSPPDGPQRRTVRNDTLKWVLSEVLRDIREKELCYIKYEVKQACFHITVR